MKKSTEYSSIHSYLSHVGLSETEAELYLLLLKTNGATIAKVTKLSRIPRTSVVRHLDKLLEKGLVSIVTKNAIKKYVPENPQKVEHLIKDQEIEFSTKLNEVMRLKRSLPLMLEHMASGIQPHGYGSSDVVVKYYEGIHGFRDVHNRSLDYAEGEIMFLSNHNFWREAYTEEYDSTIFVPERVKRGIKMRSLVIENEQGKRLKETAGGVLREVRFLPQYFDFATTTILYKNNVCLMISSKPYIAINIQSEAVYKTQKNVFEFLWELST